MKQIHKMLIALVAIVAMTTSVHAGSFGLGVTGALMNIEASGTETEGTAADESMKTATAGNNAFIGSIFAEYTFDGMMGMTFGVDYVPGSADVNSKKLSRTDTETSVEGDATTNADSRTKSANAEIENHMTYYVELPIHSSGMFVRLGHVEMDVNTTENLDGNSGSYGNQSVDGIAVGLGIKQELSDTLYYKGMVSHTEYDGFTLKETGQTATSKANSIKVDGIETTKASLAIGYKF